MRSLFFFLRLVSRAVCAALSVVWLWCYVSVSSYAQTQPDMVWEQTNGPEGGSISCFAVSGTSIFAGTNRGGIFRSTNNGETWIPISNTSVGISALTVSGSTIFAGTVGGGVFCSTDNGMTWSVRNGLELFVSSLIVSQGMLFAGTGRGVFRSANNGITWTVMSEGLTNTSITTLIASGSNIFAGTYGNGVFRSTDNGASWTEANKGLSNTYAQSLGVIGSTLFLGTESGGIFRSMDNGLSWTMVNTGLTNPKITSLVMSGGSIFAGTNQGGIFRSTDNGETWTATSKGLLDTAVWSLAVKDNAIFAGTNQGGVFRSADNGETWNTVNTGLINTFVDFLTSNDSTLFAGMSGGRGLFSSTDNGNLWNAINTGLTNTNVTSFVVNGTAFFTGTLGGGVFRSTDNGLSWNPVNTGLTDIRVTALTASNGILVIGTDSSIFRSTDNGASWNIVKTKLRRISIQSFAVNGNNLFAGTGSTGIFRSTDKGLSWTAMNEGLTMDIDSSYRRVHSLAVSNGCVFASVGYGIFRSTDNGISWVSVSNGGLRYSLVLALVMNKNTLFAGTLGDGVFRSTDNGDSWTAVNTGLKNKRVWSLAIKGNSLFAGTSWNGVFRAVTISIPPPTLSATPQQISLDTITHFDSSPQKTYTVIGANLRAPVIITAPEGILLFNPTTSAWVRSLTLATSATGSVMQTLAVRLDSSGLRSIVNQEITHTSIGTQATVRVSGAVVPLFLPEGAETTLEMRLVAPRRPMLLRDTARVQLWLKDSRLLAPRLIGRFLRNLRVTFRLDTNNFNIIGVTSPASTRVRFETAPQLPRTSPFTTLLVERIDTTTTRELLFAELLLQAAIGATATNTLRAAQPTEWTGNTPSNTPRITWGADSLRLEILPLFAPRRQTTFTAVAAPNPSDGEVELHYTLSPTTQGVETLTLIVSDMAGRTLQRRELGERKTGEAQRETVNVRGLAAGSYQLQLLSSSEILLGRVDIVR